MQHRRAAAVAYSRSIMTEHACAADTSRSDSVALAARGQSDARDGADPTTASRVAAAATTGRSTADVHGYTLAVGRTQSAPFSRPDALG